MSGNVHPNPGPIFSCLVCTANVTWHGKSVQCCTCSKWVHLRCSQLSISKFRTVGSSHSWSCLPCCVPSHNSVTPSLDSSDMYTSTVQSSPSLLMLHSLPTLVSKPLIPHFISSPSAPSPPSLAPGCPFMPPASSPPLTLLRFFNGMLEVFEPGALNYFNFFHLILLILSVSRNPILTHLPL